MSDTPPIDPSALVALVHRLRGRDQTWTAEAAARFDAWLDGVERDEAEDWLHLWRWTSSLLGVDERLLPTSEPEAARLSELIRDTQGPPDYDARRLVAGVLGDAARRPGGIWLAQGLCRALLGDPLADALDLPRTPARHAVRAAAALVRPMEALRARSRRLEDHLVSRGRTWWEESIRFSSGGRPLTFEPPARLRS
jgi:hypothetical protein